MSDTQPTRQVRLRESTIREIQILKAVSGAKCADDVVRDALGLPAAEPQELPDEPENEETTP